jgi:TolB protein
MKDKNKLFILRMIFILSLLFPVIIHAQFTPVQITTNTKYQLYPSVWGNRIVWQDERNKTGLTINYDTYMYTLPSGPEQRINISTKDQSHPEIWKNIIVWSDLRNGNRDIYMYDINTSTETQVTTNSEYQEYPDVSDSIIVWKDRRNGASWEYDVYMYDMHNGSEARVSTETSSIQNDEGPRISGHKIVWSQYSGSSNSIFLFDLDSGNRELLTSDPYDQYAPDIHGDTVVWLDYRNGRCSLYMEDLATHNVKLITDQITVHSKPKISDKGIVWDVLVDMYGNHDIYFYEFASEAVVPVMTSAYSEEHPSIWSNRIVWDDASSGNWDIYYLDFVRPPGADIYVTQKDNPEPVMLNGYLTYTISVGNYGFDNSTNVLLTNTLSSKTEFYYASSSQGTCSYAGGVVTCNLGNIGFKDSVTVNIVVIPRDTGYAHNTSVVSADQSDLITFNNSYTSKTHITSYTVDEVPFSRDIKDLSLDVDSYGTAHISCTSEGEFYPNNGTDVIYMTNRTGVWESRRIYNGVADNHIDLGNPPYDLWNGESSLIAVDGSNHEHICYVKHFTRTSVFGDPLDENYKLYYTNNVAGTWQSPVELIELPYIRPVALDIDNNGNAHIAFLTAGVATTCSLYYFTNASGSWEYEILHNKVYDHASMVIDKNNLIHFSFYSMDIKDDDSNEQGLGYFNGVFGSWNTPEKIDNVGGQIERMQTSIAVDNSNNPHISYLGGQYGYNKYAFKNSGSWTVAQIDTGWGSGCTSLDLDNSGKAYILYTPLYGKDIFRYAQNTSGTFEHCDIENADHFQIKIDNDGKYHMVYNNKYLTNRTHTDQYGGGGTGTGGYYFVTSDEEAGSMPSQPTYEWINPATEGHNQISSWTVGDADDGYKYIADIGMAFPFFNRNYNQVFICSNGYLSFANGSIDNAEYAFVPSSIQPDNFIAGCAMDLDCGKTDSKVYYHSTSSQFVVTYWHVYDKGSDSDYITFQVILYSNGNIKIQFNDSESIVPAPESIDGNAFVGIENQDGSEGLSYHNNGDGGPLFGSPLAVMFGMDPYVMPVETPSMRANFKYFLAQNFPNPFNPLTKIEFELKEDGYVKLFVYNILGQKVRELINRHLNAGNHRAIFDAGNLASGIYLYKLEVKGKFVSVNKMVLLK